MDPSLAAEHNPPPSPALTPWHYWRTLLLTLALLAHLLNALPIKHRLTPELLRRAEAQREVQTWLKGVNALGFRLSRGELEQLVILQSGRLASLFRVLNAPFAPVLTFTGTGQRWALFAFPDNYPSRLVVEGDASDGTWVPLFRTLSADADFLRTTLRYRRVRGMYNQDGKSPLPAWRPFTRWVAEQAFAFDPHLSRVRVSLERFHTTIPGQPADAETTREAKTVWLRSDLEPNTPGIRSEKE